MFRFHILIASALVLGCPSEKPPAAPLAVASVAVATASAASETSSKPVAPPSRCGVKPVASMPLPAPETNPSCTPVLGTAHTYLRHEITKRFFHTIPGSTLRIDFVAREFAHDEARHPCDSEDPPGAGDTTITDAEAAAAYREACTRESPRDAH